MAQIAWFILVVRLLGHIRMCQLVLKDQITWPNPVSPMSRRVTVGVETLRRGVEAVMVVLAIVLVAFFGAGVVFGLNWIYSRSVRRVPNPPSSQRQNPAGGDPEHEVWPYRH